MYNSSCINKVILLGFVSEDPGWHTLDGRKVLTFTLVTDEIFKKNGRSVDHHELHQIRVPEDVLADMTIGKDMQLYLQGKLQTRQVRDEHGIKHYRSEILASVIEVMQFGVPQTAL